ncbi:MAG: hypothetical protein HFE73_04070 [Firmicutes bacterium]|nr:hypothetical protein [Bacillota bacterium]
MNILILTGRFGMGHISAAQAIAEDIGDTSCEASVATVDFMEYLFPELNRVIYHGFNFLVSRCSTVYNHLNKAAGKYGDVPLKLALLRKIDSLMERYQPDLIIATLPVCGQYISAYKKRRCCQVPLYTYITDITLHEEWIADETDLYFVGDLSTKNALISRGVSPSKILVTGIPVRKVFHQAQEEQSVQARQEAQKRLDGSGESSCAQVLIMGGGLGLIPGGNQLLKTMNSLDSVSVTLIAGRNHRLAEEVREKYPNIHVVGFTNRVDQYLKQADLIITKPGGITTFEAIAAKTPLFVVHPFLEQERGNALFIESANIGRIIWDKHADIAAEFLALFRDKTRLLAMQSNMSKLEASFSPVGPLEYYMEREMEKCC